MVEKIQKKSNIHVIKTLNKAKESILPSKALLSEIISRVSIDEPILRRLFVKRVFAHKWPFAASLVVLLLVVVLIFSHSVENQRNKISSQNAYRLSLIKGAVNKNKKIHAPILVLPGQGLRPKPRDVGYPG